MGKNPTNKGWLLSPQPSQVQCLGWGKATTWPAQHPLLESLRASEGGWGGVGPDPPTESTFCLQPGRVPPRILARPARGKKVQGPLR